MGDSRLLVNGQNEARRQNGSQDLPIATKKPSKRTHPSPEWGKSKSDETNPVDHAGDSGVESSESNPGTCSTWCLTSVVANWYLDDCLIKWRLNYCAASIHLENRR